MRRTCLVLGAAALWQTGVTTTFADSAVYALADVTRDSNLFRLSDSANTVALLGTDQREDTYTRGELGFRTDANAGRQHFNVNGNVNHSRFDRFSYLDNTGGTANAVWNWAVGNQWQGELGYGYNRMLAAFELQSTGQNIRTQKHGFANANYQFHPSWRTRVALDDLKTDYSAATSQDRISDGRSGEVGLEYVAASQSTVGVRVRRTQGDFPNHQLVGTTMIDNSFEQTDTGVTLDWRASGHTRVVGGVDYTRRTHSQFSSRDYDGPTARLNVDWNQSDKLLWRAAAWRELTESDDLTPSYVVSDGVSLIPSWSISSKVNLAATASRVKRDYRGDPRIVLLVLTQRREDVVNTATLTLRYLPTPHIGVNMSYTDERRTSNTPLDDYRDRIVNAGLRVEF